MAGYVGLELGNVVANYPFESSRRFPGSQSNSSHGDHSRLSCGVGDTQLGAGFCRDLQQAFCTGVGHHAASPRRHELAAISSFDQKMIGRRQSQQHHCAVCAGLSAPRERVVTDTEPDRLVPLAPPAPRALISLYVGANLPCPRTPCSARTSAKCGSKG
jgi:hypothetical protein